MTLILSGIESLHQTRHETDRGLHLRAHLGRVRLRRVRRGRLRPAHRRVARDDQQAGRAGP